MPDFIQFNEGSSYIALNGWPSTTWFFLSTTPIGSLTQQSVLTSGLGEITGTGYTRYSQARPLVVSGSLVFNAMTWLTVAAADWPSDVYSIIATTTSNNTGVALCAWHLAVNGVVRDLSTPNSTLEVTPTYVF